MTLYLFVKQPRLASGIRTGIYSSINPRNPHACIHLSRDLPVRRPVYLYTNLSTYFSVHAVYAIINLSIYVSLYFSICIFIYRSFFLLIFLSINLSIYLSKYLFICLFSLPARPTIHLCFHLPNVDLHVYPSIIYLGIFNHSGRNHLNGYLSIWPLCMVKVCVTVDHFKFP